MSRSVYKYNSQKKEDGKLVAELLRLRERHKRYGVLRLTVLLKRKGFHVNKKRVYRITKTLNLLVPRKTRMRKLNIAPVRKFILPQRSNDLWAIDFMQARLINGSSFRCFTAVDVYSRRSPVIFVAQTMQDAVVVKKLEALKRESCALPKAIIMDNGPELKNYALLNWSKQNDISLHYIEPAEPVQNAFIESFNARLRDECLNQHRFISIKHARQTIERWRNHYNQERPHSSLDYRTPKEFAEAEEKILANVQPDRGEVVLKTG